MSLRCHDLTQDSRKKYVQCRESSQNIEDGCMTEFKYKWKKSRIISFKLHAATAAVEAGNILSLFSLPSGGAAACSCYFACLCSMYLLHYLSQQASEGLQKEPTHHHQQQHWLGREIIFSMIIKAKTFNSPRWEKKKNRLFSNKAWRETVFFY